MLKIIRNIVCKHSKVEIGEINVRSTIHKYKLARLMYYCLATEAGYKPSEALTFINEPPEDATRYHYELIVSKGKERFVKLYRTCKSSYERAERNLRKTAPVRPITTYTKAEDKAMKRAMINACRFMQKFGKSAVCPPNSF